MKRIFHWQVVFGIVLIALSAATYFIHYLIFRDARHIFIYLIGDIAFVFLEVLLVTLVLHQLLHHREKRATLSKLNMVIGMFFSEIGTELIRKILSFDENAADFSSHLRVTDQWIRRDFAIAKMHVRAHHYVITVNDDDLRALKAFLGTKRDFLLAMLANPNVLAHESFTNLLWAVFHAAEELSYRKDLSALPESDRHHLVGDINRVCHFLLLQWLDHLRHLKQDYPYLFSLAVRLNPFDADARVEVV